MILRGPRTYEQYERALQQQVTQLLAAILPRGTFFTAFAGGDGRRTTTPGYVAGTPDLLIVYAGRAIFIELKRPKKGRIATHQKFVHERIALAGALVAVCRTPAEVVDFLAQIIPLRRPETHLERLL